MLYRSNTWRVRWPLIAIAIFSGISARAILRTALRRRSWNSCPSSFAPSQAGRIYENRVAEYSAHPQRPRHLEGILQVMALTAQEMFSERCGSPLLSFVQPVTRLLDGYKDGYNEHTSL